MTTTPEGPDAELLVCQDVDQHARDFAIRDEEPTKAEVERLSRVDHDNTAWLENVVAAETSPISKTRVTTHERRPQRYGTQSIGRDGATVRLAPLEDPQRVNEFRTDAGLNP